MNNTNVKTKIFKFEVSNSSSYAFGTDDKNQEWFIAAQKRLINEETIEKTINDFLDGKVYVDMKVNTIDVNYHNNAGGNTIHMIYTILYSEECESNLSK